MGSSPPWNGTKIGRPRHGDGDRKDPQSLPSLLSADAGRRATHPRLLHRRSCGNILVGKTDFHIIHLPSVLGPVDIHLAATIAAAKSRQTAQLMSVLSYRIAMARIA